MTPTREPTGTILIVEDDPHTADLERRALMRAGQRVRIVGLVTQALAAMREETFAAILLDYRLPDGEPWPVLEAARRALPPIPVILVTAMGDERVAAEVLHRGGADYLIKTEGFWEQLTGAVERVLKVARIEQSNARLAALVESSDDAIFSQSLAGDILSWNSGAQQLFGYTAGEAVGKPVSLLSPPECREKDAAIAAGILRGEATRQLQTTRIRKDGSAVEVSLTVSPVLDAAEQVVSAACIARDITAWQDAQQALRQSAELDRALFIGSPLPMWLYDIDSLRILSVNDAAVVQYGYSSEELLTMSLHDIHSPETPPALDTEHGEVPEYHRTGIFRHRRKDGTVIRVDVYVHDVWVAGRRSRLALLQDVTEHLKLEDQLRQSQKMEAIGQLAGGIAHDFNNLLTIVNGYTDILLARSRPGVEGYEELAEIRKAGERAASLTRQLLAFGRQRELDPKVIDLNSAVTDMDKLLRRLIGEQIELVVVPSPVLGSVRTDAGQIEQVIMNLAVNARDAMSGGGTLTIETANVEVDEGFTRSHVGVLPGPYVVLAVTDTGCGMDTETQQRIFEPFFTTKEPGRGTGLGLATVFGIVKQSGGHIYVYSEPDRGSTFKIYLPRVDSPPSPRLAGASARAGKARGETVLVVEDEEQVRRLTCIVLAEAGYVVLEAANPEQALTIADDRPARIDLLVTDVIMPGMVGPALVRQIALRRPGLKTLFLSGYTGRTVSQNGELDENAPFLEKPYTPQALLSKVRDVLDATSA